MELAKKMPVKLGNIYGDIYGGPFRNFVPNTRRLVGVKMAAEIDHPHDFRVDTEDFSIPEEHDVLRGLAYAIRSLSEGKDIYAGCMGGTGRTGLFMGCMAKLMKDYGEDVDDPVLYVRKHYKPHAIETAQQVQFVRELNTSELIPLVRTLQPHRVEYVYLSPWKWVVQLAAKMFDKTK